MTTDDHEIFALRSSEIVNKYLDRKRSQSLMDARNFIQTINENIQRNDSIYWAITCTDADKLVGTICLFDFFDNHAKAEIGYELLPHFQGKGIMQEAILPVLHFAFQQVGLTSIEAFTHIDNRNSTRLLEKLNFKSVGVANENFTIFKWIYKG